MNLAFLVQGSIPAFEKITKVLSYCYVNGYQCYDQLLSCKII